MPGGPPPPPPPPPPGLIGMGAGPPPPAAPRANASSGPPPPPPPPPPGLIGMGAGPPPPPPTAARGGGDFWTAAASSATSSWSHRDGSGASSSAADGRAFRGGDFWTAAASSATSSWSHRDGSGASSSAAPPARDGSSPRDRRRLLRHLLLVSSGWERPQRLHRLPPGLRPLPLPASPASGVDRDRSVRAASPGAAEAACSAEIRAAARSRGHRRGDDAT